MLKISAVDAGVVIQKIIIANSEVNRTQAHAGAQAYHFQNSYFGAPESFYQGAAAETVVSIGNDVLTQAAAVNGTPNKEQKGCGGCNSNSSIFAMVTLSLAGVLLARKRMA